MKPLKMCVQYWVATEVLPMSVSLSPTQCNKLGFLNISKKTYILMVAFLFVNSCLLDRRKTDCQKSNWCLFVNCFFDDICTILITLARFQLNCCYIRLMEWSCVACDSKRRIWSVLSVHHISALPCTILSHMLAHVCTIAHFHHTCLHIHIFSALASTIGKFYHKCLHIHISST